MVEKVLRKEDSLLDRIKIKGLGDLGPKPLVEPPQITPQLLDELWGSITTPGRLPPGTKFHSASGEEIGVDRVMFAICRDTAGLGEHAKALARLDFLSRHPGAQESEKQRVIGEEIARVRELIEEEGEAPTGPPRVPVLDLTQTAFYQKYIEPVHGLDGTKLRGTLDSLEGDALRVKTVFDGLLGWHHVGFIGNVLAKRISVNEIWEDLNDELSFGSGNLREAFMRETGVTSDDEAKKLLVEYIRQVRRGYSGVEEGVEAGAPPDVRPLGEGAPPRGREVPEEEVQELITRLVTGLEYRHRMISTRNISPDSDEGNVYFEREGVRYRLTTNHVRRTDTRRYPFMIAPVEEGVGEAMIITAQRMHDEVEKIVRGGEFREQIPFSRPMEEEGEAPTGPPRVPGFHRRSTRIGLTLVTAAVLALGIRYGCGIGRHVTTLPKPTPAVERARAPAVMPEVEWETLPGGVFTAPEGGATIKWTNDNPVNINLPGGSSVAVPEETTITLHGDATLTIGSNCRVNLPAGARITKGGFVIETTKAGEIPLSNGDVVTMTGDPIQVDVPADATVTSTKGFTTPFSNGTTAVVKAGAKVDVPDGTQVAMGTGTVQSVAGHWSSPGPGWGEITIEQRGVKITGTYVHDNGKIEGEYNPEEKRWDFRWHDEVRPGQDSRSGSGDGYFTVSEDGKKLTVKWRWQGEKDFNRTSTSSRIGE